MKIKGVTQWLPVTAAVAISLTIVSLITVSLIVGFIFWKKKKHIQRVQTEAPIDENPAYGVYEEYENGEVRSETTAEFWKKLWESSDQCQFFSRIPLFGPLCQLFLHIP